jgi:chromosome segregation ATPase
MGKQTRQTTQAGVLGELTRLSAALDANAVELEHLEGARVRFAALVAEAQQTAREQAYFAASKQEASRRLERLLSEGQRMSTGLGRLLQEFYGIASEKLTEFGLQPFRGRTRRSEPEEPEPPVPSPPVEIRQPAADETEV